MHTSFTNREFRGVNYNSWEHNRLFTLGMLRCKARSTPDICNELRGLATIATTTTIATIAGATTTTTTTTTSSTAAAGSKKYLLDRTHWWLYQNGLSFYVTYNKREIDR